MPTKSFLEFNPLNPLQKKNGQINSEQHRKRDRHDMYGEREREFHKQDRRRKTGLEKADPDPSPVNNTEPKG